MIFLNEKGSYTISCIRARNKDFNEDLKEQNNVEFIKSTDSPKYQEAMKYVSNIKSDFKTIVKDKFQEDELIRFLPSFIILLMEKNHEMILSFRHSWIDF